MVAVGTVVRRLSRKSLQGFLAAKQIALTSVDWNAKTGSIARTVLAAIEGLDADTQGRIVNDAERIGALADEPGQVAIYSVVTNPATLDGLENGYERSLWLFLNEPTVFQRAEEVRYTDQRRRGKHWDGFLVEADGDLRRDAAAIAAFRDAIRRRFGSKNVHVDIFDRSRQVFSGAEHALIQATVYSEGRLEDYLQFVDGVLDLKGRRPVIEACLTYEPGAGVVEAVASDRATREEYVRIFARELLDVDFDESERVPLRRFDLSPLLSAHEFPTDAVDRIESVRVTSLRLMPIDSAGERVTIECMGGEKKNIWQVAETRFGSHNPLSGGWVATQARLIIRFHPEQGAAKGKTLPLTITMPHGCDLKDRTERERLVGEKYLRAWRLLEEL